MISFLKKQSARTGNVIFQYLACKAVGLVTGHTYITFESMQSTDYELVDEDAIIDIIHGKRHITKDIILDGYFQNSEIFKNREQILNSIHSDTWIFEDRIVSMRDFLEATHTYDLTNAVVISLRLDDFIQYPCPTSDIIPVQFYTNILETLHFEKLIIICDITQTEWEKEYIKHFSKWNPIYQFNTLLFDCAVMRDADILIHSNSSLSWIMSFLRSKKRYIPQTHFYGGQHLNQIEDSDELYDVSPLSHQAVLSLNYETTLMNRISPLSYCIPDELIVADASNKLHVWAEIIPNEPKTYRFDNEYEYYKMYHESRFAFTQKKGGWDCLRHYEIMANGCIPYFKDLDKCPKDTLTTFPKQLILNAAEQLPYNQNNQYAVDQMLTHMRSHCSTSATADYIMSFAPNAKNVLLIRGDVGVNYTRELCWIGLIRKLGSVGEYPRIDYLYDDFKDASELYGKGFTYSCRLHSDTAPLSETAIINKINDKFWDLIIFGKVGPDEMHCGSIPHLPLWSHIVGKYTNDQLMFLYGGDECNDLTYNNRYKEHLLKHAQYGRCFVRELVR